MKIFYLAVVLLGVVLGISAAAVDVTPPGAPEVYPRSVRSADSQPVEHSHEHQKDDTKACCG